MTRQLGLQERIACGGPDTLLKAGRAPLWKHQGLGGCEGAGPPPLAPTHTPGGCGSFTNPDAIS